MRYLQTAVGLTALWLILLAAGLGCTPTPPSAEELLLTPADFPQQSLRPAQEFDPRETPGGGQSAQTVLATDDLQIYQSLVIFPEDDGAATALQAVQEGGVGADWQEAPSAPRFGDDSVVFIGRQGGEAAALAVFRKGRVLQRVTVVGSNDPMVLAEYARRAAAKTGH